MTHPHPFRFGVVSPLHGSASDVGAEARSYQDAGYSTVLTPDTLWTPSPFLALTAAAAGTTTLHVGTWVLAAPLRRAAEVVREARALQELSGGRLELGVGAGRPGGEGDAAALGVEWGAPGRRVDRVEETLAAAAALDPTPRLVVAGSGERMLRLAARYADTLALPAPPTTDVEGIVALADRARAAGRSAGRELELSLQIVAVAGAVPEWQRRQGLAAEALAGAAGALSGDVGRDADALHVLRERTGISYLTIPGEFAQLLAPLVTALAGA